MAACGAAGYTYAATQSGSECFCGDSYGGQGPSGGCTVACSGDAGQTCGGAYANGVYAVKPAAKPPPQYLGCFGDSSSPRDLSAPAYSSLYNSTEACIADCAYHGYTYAGTQSGQQCFCGNSYGGHGPAGDCTEACAGDAMEICGGNYANSVYATTPITIPTAQYLGCFADSASSPDFSFPAYASAYNTTAACVADCAYRGYAYAGTQAGNKCFCGDIYGGQGPSGACAVACSGDASETCGGTNANSVYATKPVTIPAPEYLGCFADSASHDLPSLAYDSAYDTTEDCISDCAYHGFKYAATQGGSECFCGNAYGGQGPSAGCTVKCSGDTTETCGGSYANSVYAAKAVTIPAPKYLGCFADGVPHDLADSAYNSGYGTTESCIADCTYHGFLYAGTQLSTQCFCGDTYGAYGASTGCSDACGGNTAETCGGFNSDSVYRTTVPAIADAGADTG